MILVNSKLFGIDKNALKMLGIINKTVFVKSLSVELNVLFYVVDNGTMNYNYLLRIIFTNNNLIK